MGIKMPEFFKTHLGIGLGGARGAWRVFGFSFLWENGFHLQLTFRSVLRFLAITNKLCEPKAIGRFFVEWFVCASSEKRPQEN